MHYRSSTSVIENHDPAWPGVLDQSPNTRPLRVRTSRYLGADGNYYRVAGDYVLVETIAREVVWRWSVGEGLQRWADLPEAFDELDFAARAVINARFLTIQMVPRLIAEATPEQLRYMMRFAALTQGRSLRRPVSLNRMTVDSLPGWEFRHFRHARDQGEVWAYHLDSYRGLWQVRDGWTFLDDSREETLAELADVAKGFHL